MGLKPGDVRNGEKDPSRILDYLVTALVQEYLVAVIIVVVLFFFVCMGYFGLKKCFRKRKYKERGLDSLDDGPTTKTGTAETQLLEVTVKKRTPTPDDSVKERRTRADTRSIVDMLDTVEWLRQTLREGGMSSNDAAMEEVKTLLRRLRQLKHAYPPDDELDYDLTPIMPTTPTGKICTTEFQVPRPSQNCGEEETKMREMLEIKGTLQGLTEKVASLRNSFRLKNNETFRRTDAPYSLGRNVRFSRQPSSFSSSSLVCYESSPVADNTFEIPPPMKNNLRTQTSLCYAAPNTAPTPPKRADSFKRTGFLNKGSQPEGIVAESTLTIKDRIAFLVNNSRGNEDNPRLLVENNIVEQNTKLTMPDKEMEEIDEHIQQLLDWSTSKEPSFGNYNKV